jgi:hypothetical protein
LNSYHRTHPYARVLNQSNIPAIEHALIEFVQWQSNKNVSANLDHTVISPASAHPGEEELKLWMIRPHIGKQIPAPIHLSYRHMPSRRASTRIA